ncbi:PREDICTED: lysophospholipid acyltransferase 2 [Condylura cristata]|uniref:lysophospholipid acyltransferase 2 n=1 Tax=Condylura cristata TaxID=143302 RepID=UPI000642D5FB|nr:PREDICTED: lysophospholipid acyltransferase 2 [Condylura cristata]
MVTCWPQPAHESLDISSARCCFVFALGYLTVCQVTRVYIFDYGQYSADFSGPMMIITQKITSLAHEIHDGEFQNRPPPSAAVGLTLPCRGPGEPCMDADRGGRRGRAPLSLFPLTPPRSRSRSFCRQTSPKPRGGGRRRLSSGCLPCRRMPSLLEHLSYTCNFMGILAGPLCSYKDYITFIEGRSSHATQPGGHGREDDPRGRPEPSPNAAVLQKLLVCALSLLLHLTVARALPVERNIDAHFRATASWPARVLYLYVSLLAARPKYYFAWTLAGSAGQGAAASQGEARRPKTAFAGGAGSEGGGVAEAREAGQVCREGTRGCGLGIATDALRSVSRSVGGHREATMSSSGVSSGHHSSHEDSHSEGDCGHAANDGRSMSTSFKMFLDNWNIQTALWLKRVCYERASLSPTVQTFVLSAIWHGVYPGYYLTFLTGMVMTLAARTMRNNFRHYFVDPPPLKLLYDVVTWAVTQVAISYTVVPFVLLSVRPSVTFYSSWYFILHILGILVLLLLPGKRPQGGRGTNEDAQLPPPKKFDDRDGSWGQNSFPTTNSVYGLSQERASRHSSLRQ